MKIFLSVFIILVLLSSSIISQTEMVKVTDDVYAFIGPDPTADWVDGNSVAIFGSGGVFVVDANIVSPSSEKTVGFIGEHTTDPVKYVLVTHWHYDHYLGMESFTKAFPGLEIITHTETRRLMLNNIPRYLAVSVKTFQDEIDTAKAELLRGTKADGTPLTKYEIGRSEKSVKDADYYMPALKNSVFIPPTVTFDSEMNIWLGEKEIQIRHYGRGNTPGDAFVYLPKEKILVTGDLLVYPIPYAFGCYPTEWIKTLKQMSQLDADIIIPGHGNIQYNKDYILNVIDALQIVVDRVSKLAKDGMSLEEVKKNANFDDLKTKLAGGDEDKLWTFDNYFITPIIPRAYQEAKGTL